MKKKRGQPETSGNVNIKELESVKTAEKKYIRKRNRKE